MRGELHNLPEACQATSIFKNFWQHAFGLGATVMGSPRTWRLSRVKGNRPPMPAAEPLASRAELSWLAVAIIIISSSSAG